MNIRRVDRRPQRTVRGTGKARVPVPTGILPVLRAAWGLANDVAQKFCKNLKKDRSEEFLENLKEKF